MWHHVLQPQHARALETFGKLLNLRPDLAAPLTRTALEVLAGLPMTTPARVSSVPIVSYKAWLHVTPAWSSIASNRSVIEIEGGCSELVRRNHSCCQAAPTSPTYAHVCDLFTHNFHTASNASTSAAPPPSPSPSHTPHTHTHTHTATTTCPCNAFRSRHHLASHANGS
jgi:hypothetical protein